jgi:hypothetical protein
VALNIESLIACPFPSLIAGRKLRIYLDTAYERGASDFYEKSIRPALLSSRYLLVVTTPDAVRCAGEVEDWIQREISDFSAGPNGSNVIAVRAAGEFNGPLPGDLKERFLPVDRSEGAARRQGQAPRHPEWRRD